ncbi:hypothetical protein [Aquimarina sp. RZ0]|uniref:hypothetical protein n=1 Tax=Aquimarina sp. RZ0 TaxID=2607730 RepID=UPI0011F21035|nr:hypothetical protein [Aquimarina sp. RZ0]KAA1239799.1 hypothetical protein F0000_27280 [Aquimarina sp. RZ0]
MKIVYFRPDTIEPIEQRRMEMMRESREFVRDNTYVTPRAIYSTRYHLLHTIAVKIVSFGSILRHKIVSIAKAIHRFYFLSISKIIQFCITAIVYNNWYKRF